MEAIDLGQFFTYSNNLLTFNEGYCNFSGNVSLMNKRIKNNHKYYVYNRSTGNPVSIPESASMNIIEKVESDGFQFIFYIDSNHKLSFIKSRKHQTLDENDIVDKIEKTPLLKVSLFYWLQSIIIFGVLRFRTYSFESIEVSLGYDKAINAKVHFLFPQRIRKKFAMNTNKFTLLIHFFWCSIPLKELARKYHKDSEINIPFFLKILNENFNYYYNLKYSSKDKYNRNHYIYSKPSKKVKKSDLELFVRKSITGQYVAVFTSVLELRVKMLSKMAYILSLFKRNKEVYNVYFEKFCEGASESAFELFKYAVKKDKKAIYILSRDNPEFASLKRQYPNNIVAQNTLESFYVVFLANSFISSDLVSHIQRRLYDNDSLIKKKILSNDKKVFLQHGVCLATNVFERGYYNTKVPIAPDYIIVNSEFEKSKFMSYTNYRERQLIKTGLPNLDLYVNEKDSVKDEVTFLLTWRPWDLTDKIEEGSYLDRYRTFINMVRNNQFYDEKKVNIVLHPKSKIILREQFPDFYEEHEHQFFDGDIKDALLKSKVLISDYSSVTFYAFSGGSNVVFYWEDKLAAEKEYGAPNILQESIAFGDIVYNFNDLQLAVEKAYETEQKKNYIDMFSQLVEHQDGDNTKKAFDYIYEKILWSNSEVKSEQFVRTLKNV